MYMEDDMKTSMENCENLGKKFLPWPPRNAR